MSLLVVICNALTFELSINYSVICTITNVLQISINVIAMNVFSLKSFLKRQTLWTLFIMS